MAKVLLLDDNKVFIYYEPKKDDKVTIINYDQNKIKSRDKLLEIINRPEKYEKMKKSANNGKKVFSYREISKRAINGDK